MNNVRLYSYGNYKSDNGKCKAVQLGDVTLYFSYETLIAFEGPELVISENVWSRTTGKHLNWISRDKDKRVPYSKFKERARGIVERYGINIMEVA